MGRARWGEYFELESNVFYRSYMLSQALISSSSWPSSRCSKFGLFGQEQLREREKTVHELERMMEDKDREVHAIKLDNEVVC